MALTKAQLRTMVRQYLDDPNGKRWTDTNLDLAIQFVLDDLWGDLLDQAPYLTTQYQQITSLHTPGYIDLRLTMFSGDLTQRFYRLQQCIADGRHYFAKDPRDYLMTASSATGDVTTIRADTGVEQRYSYQFLGDQLWLHPLGQVTTFVELRYSFKPVAFTQMTNGFPVPFPEGHEHAIVLLSAAHAMAKGNAEESKPLYDLGAVAKDKMLNAVRRQQHGMTQPWTGDNAWSWAST